jgi:hypothetical protein
LQNRVRAALALLSEADREVLVLRYLERPAPRRPMRRTSAAAMRRVN